MSLKCSYLILKGSMKKDFIRLENYNILFSTSTGIFIGVWTKRASGLEFIPMTILIKLLLWIDYWPRISSCAYTTCAFYACWVATPKVISRWLAAEEAKWHFNNLISNHFWYVGTNKLNNLFALWVLFTKTKIIIYLNVSESGGYLVLNCKAAG